MLDILIPAIVLVLFKWYLEDTWFEKKYPSYEEQEEDYGYIERE
jgi:hypothetical protein